jgi:hypothetical protein
MKLIPRPIHCKENCWYDALCSADCAGHKSTCAEMKEKGMGQITPHVFTNEEGRDMWRMLDEINMIMWENAAIGLPIPNHKIMAILDVWADKY